MVASDFHAISINCHANLEDYTGRNWHRLSRSQCLLFHTSFPSVLMRNILNYRKRKIYKLYSWKNHALSEIHIFKQTRFHVFDCYKSTFFFRCDDDGSAYSARNFIWRYEKCKKRCSCKFEIKNSTILRNFENFLSALI